MKVVRYLQQIAPFNVGETAGWSDVDADNLVLRGIAEHTDIKPVVAERSPDLDPPRITGQELQNAMAVAEARGQRTRT